MIIYTRIENYRSIGEKQILNFIPSSDKEHLESIIREQEGILPVIPIYGGNATGKTNILRSLKTLSELIVGKIELEEAYEPCKFYDKKNTNFEIIFLKKEIKYYYKLIFNKQKIVEEALYYYPNGKISKIFDRKENEYTFGITFESSLKMYSAENPQEISFLKTISKFLRGKIECIDNVRNFFEEDLVFIGIDSNHDELNEAKRIFRDNKDNKEKIQTFIEYFYKHLNIGATGIRFSNALDDPTQKDILKKILSNKELRKKIEKDLSDKNSEINLDLDMSPLINLLFNGKESLDLVYKLENKEILIPIEKESKGIQKIFTVGARIADVLYNNKILIYDELETGFHPLLARKIIELFLDKNTKAQLIFSTHNTNLLDLNIFRRDQIYFASRTVKTGYKSVFNSLGSITGVRKSTDIEKAYLEGKYSDSPTYKNFNNDELIGGLS